MVPSVIGELGGITGYQLGTFMCESAHIETTQLASLDPPGEFSGMRAMVVVDLV